jgi:hypothetical protein
LRQELNQWLQQVHTNDDKSLSSQNLQNKRFAMMAWNLAKDFRTNEFSSTYKALFK